METPEEKGPRTIRSYVIRSGRMSPLQQRSFDTLSALWCLPFREEELNLRSVFPAGEIILEIGFGMGTATAEIARRNPDKNYLGMEVHKPGVGKLLAEIESRGLSNVRIIHFDAVRVLEQMIPPGGADGFHIFFPDPWPKKKHHKRRLIQPDFVRLLLSRLKEGGYIYCVTDWEEYGLQMLEVLSSFPELENPAGTGWAESPVWRSQTAFERKGLAKDHPIREVFFRKKSTLGAETHE